MVWIQNMTEKICRTVLCLLPLCACSRVEVPLVPPSGPEKTFAIDPSCSVAGPAGTAQDSGLPTRGIIGSTTITSLDANFVKLDGSIRGWAPDEYRYAEDAFTGWNSEQAKILDASILSSPDNTEGIHFRSIVLSPRQTYSYAVNNPDGGEITDDKVTAYVSRMVGWYPKTFDLPRDNGGKPSDVVFKDNPSYVQIEKNGTLYDCVRFDRKLDGKTDLMMTDMREGRYDLSGKGFKNNTADDIDIQPYGHMFNNYMDPSQGYRYINYFTFNHYLTAIRLFIRIEDSNLNIKSWEKINNVVFVDQPQTVTVALPTVQSRGTGTGGAVSGTTPSLPVEGVAPIFGEALSWEDPVNMPIVREPMAVNDPDHPEFADTPDYPILYDNAISLEPTYLGYILAQPGRETEVEIHTDAGVEKLTIPTEWRKSDTETEPLLEAGHIYNIVINVKVEGSIEIVVSHDDSNRFRNLAPYNENISNFEYSNCYVVSPDKMKMETGDYYEGFYFPGTVAGRGSEGTLPLSVGTVYPKDVYFTPHSVRLLWQDQPYLITHVELVHGYVRFVLNEKCRDGGYQGNAVLAVLDENNSILWSWHIWVTDGIADIHYDNLTFLDPENSPSYGNSPTSTESKTISATIMNRNLGATVTNWQNVSDENAKDTYGLYYQWGRKDPSPGPPSYRYDRNDMSTRPYYYLDDGEYTRVYEHLEADPTVETAAVRPLDIIGPTQISLTYPNDWLFVSIDQLWGYDPASKKVVKKTIYDPCPYGYRVADDELFALFYDAFNANPKKSQNWAKGIVIDGGKSSAGNSVRAFFPYTGWKGHDRSRTDKTHAWFNVGNLGDYQDARVCKNSTTYMNHRGRTLIIENGMFVNGSFVVQDVTPAYTRYITNDYANRTSASPVRCVRYNASGEEPASNNP